MITNTLTTETPPIRNIWDYWVMDTPPRKSQVKTLEWMANLPPNIKYVMCEMPVGGGKSPIALTYASYLGHGTMGTSYILTPQKILQKQYEDSFDSSIIHSVYGKANYSCTGKVGLDCEIGQDIKPKCMNCPAKQAFEDIPNMPHVVLNYKLALLYADIFSSEDIEHMFPRRDLMVFDECHTLETHLVNHRLITISRNRCDSLGVVWVKPKTIQDAHSWLKNVYYSALHKKCQELAKTVKMINEKYMDGGSLLPSEIRTKRELTALVRHTELVKNLISLEVSFIDDNYVLVPGDNVFELKEIYGRNLFKKILLPKANKFLFLSSTILNKEAYCSDLGIPPEETEMISLDSEFDKDHRPVYFMPTSKMAYGWNAPEKKPLRDKMVNQVVKLCKLHEDDSGVIHTGSFQIAKWLISELRGKVDHVLMTHDDESGFNRDDLIADFVENSAKTPMLLISPSVTEGLDLKDDLARFAIFVKVPYPFLGDAWVKRRLELSDEWYQRQAMINIIQGGGRVVRTPDDWGNTYILDESFNYLWYKFKPRTPDWWKEAFSIIK